MVPLATIKDELGIPSSITDADAMLNRAIAQITRIVRQRTNRWIIGLATVAGNTSSLTVTCPEHGLKPGAKIRLKSDTAGLAGNYVIAAVTRHAFVTTTGLQSGTVSNVEASVHPYRSTWVHGSGRVDLFLPAVLVPLDELIVCQVGEEDVPFTVEDHDSDPKSIRIRKVDETIWSREYSYRGLSPAFSVRRPGTDKSILLEGYTGLQYLSGDIEMAFISMVCEMAELEGMPKDIQQSSFEGVSRSRLNGDERRQQLLSHDRVLKSWKAD